MLPGEELPKGLRHILLETGRHQRPTGSRIHDRGARPVQIGDRPIDDVDDRLIPLGEEPHIHILADDADPDPVEPIAAREGLIRLRR